MPAILPTIQLLEVNEIFEVTVNSVAVETAVFTCLKLIVDLSVVAT